MDMTMTLPNGEVPVVLIDEDDEEYLSKHNLTYMTVLIVRCRFHLPPRSYYSAIYWEKLKESGSSMLPVPYTSRDTRRCTLFETDEPECAYCHNLGNRRSFRKQMKTMIKEGHEFVYKRVDIGDLIGIELPCP